MKRGKDDEKIMGPMFPRLHVNDQEKGGPRAPPRNKMALYEQLSIPSQRFNRPGMMPHSHNNNANNVTPPASSSQGNGHENRGSFPVPVPPYKHPIEKPTSHYLTPSASLPQVEQRKEADEDDFRVPIYVLSKTGQNRGDYQDNKDTEKLAPSGPAYSRYSTELQNASNNPKRDGIPRLNVKQNAKNQNEDSISKAVSYSKSMAEGEDSPRQADKSLSFEPREDIPNRFSRLQNARSKLQPEPELEQGFDARPGRISGHRFSTQLIDLNRENSSESLRTFPVEMPRNGDVVTNDRESREEQTCRSSQAKIGDKGDDSSETSMVESVSGVDISPDDVVGIIGQKHFWKARRAIVNQQRVFAVQVFELHRLIKVQRLIAESPHLLLEDDSYLENPIKASSPKKLPLEYIHEPPTNILKNKNEPEKPTDKMECSAENTVGKMSLSSVQDGSQPFNYRPFPGNSQPTPVTNDTNGGPWIFHPQQGHQWLVPVMTPTEGLVYKPYSGPGFTSPLYGGHGPPGSTPAMGNFSSPQHYQGGGLPTFFPPAGPHGYFPQYGMPVMNPSITGQAVEQTSHFVTQDSQGEFSGGGANFSVQRQNSCNQPAQKGETFSGVQRQNSCNQPAQKGETFSGVQRQNSCNQPAQEGETFSGVQRQNSCSQPAQNGGTFSSVQKSNPPRDKELHASTASSPSGRRQRSRLGKTIEGNNALPLFPTSPARTEIPNGSISRHEDEQPSRVIRVVPHNGRSASEFAARIFRSIQEERNQNDSG